MLLCVVFSDLNYTNLVGLGFDGEAAMSGHFSGAQSLIRAELPQVHYVHCISHCLNHGLARAVKYDITQHCYVVINEIIDFFASSATLRCTLQTLLTAVPIEGVTAASLGDLCTSGWAERHDAVEQFVRLFPLLRFALDHISRAKEFNCTTQLMARIKFRETLSAMFCYSLALLHRVLTLTKPLSELGSNL